jgi:fibrillarin-like rRNA methylase
MSGPSAALRSFEPARSKLAAAVARGWSGPLPRPGERWLYLGAASGTTASHVADLLGPRGRLYAVERSPRPFSRLLSLAERWPNLLPVLADAREPERYAGPVPIVDGLYADIAQPDQVAIVLANVAVFLREESGVALVALKTSSLGRDRSAASHRDEAEAGLEGALDLERSLRLAPFYRSHFLVGGTARRSSGLAGAGPAPGSRGRRSPGSGDRRDRRPR